MYRDIEEQFIKKHPNKILMKVTIGILIISLILNLIFSPNVGTQIMIYVLVFAIIISIVNIYISVKNNKKGKRFKYLINGKKDYKDFVRLTAKRNKENLLEILEKSNIHSVEQIKEMREYYSNNKKQKYKPSAWEILALSISSFIAIWFGICSMFEKLLYDEIVVNIAVFIIFTVIIASVIYFVKGIKEIYKTLFDKYDIEDVLERLLSEIYIERCE